MFESVFNKFAGLQVFLLVKIARDGELNRLRRSIASRHWTMKTPEQHPGKFLEAVGRRCSSK